MLYTAYFIPYLAISITIMVAVARLLHRSGKPFLLDAFHGNADLADSVNTLLVVGFYLVNFGFIVWTIKTYEPMGTARQIVELLGEKVGAVTLILGIAHMFNILVLAKMRSGAKVQTPFKMPERA